MVMWLMYSLLVGGLFAIAAACAELVEAPVKTRTLPKAGRNFETGSNN